MLRNTTIRNHSPAPSFDDDGSFGLTELFAEKSAQKDDEDFGLADLFREPAPTQQAPEQKNQPNFTVYSMPAESFLAMLNLGMGLQNALDLLVILGIAETMTIPANVNANDNKPAADNNVKQRNVDKIASPLLARRGLFRCPKGMDHLHCINDGTVYSGPLPKEEPPAPKQNAFAASYFSFNKSEDSSSDLSSESSDSSDDEIMPFFTRFI